MGEKVVNVGINHMFLLSWPLSEVKLLLEAYSMCMLRMLYFASILLSATIYSLSDTKIERGSDSFPCKSMLLQVPQVPAWPFSRKCLGTQMLVPQNYLLVVTNLPTWVLQLPKSYY